MYHAKHPQCRTFHILQYDDIYKYVHLQLWLNVVATSIAAMNRGIFDVGFIMILLFMFVTLLFITHKLFAVPDELQKAISYHCGTTTFVIILSVFDIANI